MEFKFIVETQYSPCPISFFKELLDDHVAVDQAKALLKKIARSGGELKTSVGLQVERDGRTIICLTFDDNSPRHGSGHHRATPLDGPHGDSAFQWSVTTAD